MVSQLGVDKAALIRQEKTTGTIRIKGKAIPLPRAQKNSPAGQGRQKIWPWHGFKAFFVIWMAPDIETLAAAEAAASAGISEPWRYFKTRHNLSLPATAGPANVLL